MKWMDKKNFWNKNQHGYRKGRNTTTALMDIVTKIIGAIDNGDAVEMINFDLSKAFDVVSHTILFDKLTSYGFRGIVLKLLESYLMNRYQKVNWKDEISVLQKIECGVPQGSILGPLLFLLYINDMSFQHCDCLL